MADKSNLWQMSRAGRDCGQVCISPPDRDICIGVIEYASHAETGMGTEEGETELLKMILRSINFFVSKDDGSPRYEMRDVQARLTIWDNVKNHGIGQFSRDAESREEVEGIVASMNCVQGAVDANMVPIERDDLELMLQSLENDLKLVQSSVSFGQIWYVKRRIKKIRGLLKQ